MSGLQKIPEEDYIKIVETVPICCVDIIVYHKKKVLLVCRDNEPAKGLWWVPGGRIYKDETLEEAAKRKVLEETGIEIELIKKINFYETIFDKNSFDDSKSGVHTVNAVYLAKPKKDNQSIKLDKTSSNYKWIDDTESDLDKYVKEIPKDSGVFS